MIQHKFKIEEAILSLPKQGEERYIMKTSYPINYLKNIYCSIKREFSIKIKSQEGRSHMRLITINVYDSNFIFSEGSFAMQDILTRVAKIYSNLELKISYKGEIITINNIEELQEKWQTTKRYIQEKYKGNQVNRFIYKTDQTISSEALIIKELSLYKNFGAVLKPIYQNYNSDQYQVIQQNIPTKSGIMCIDEQFLLDSIQENGHIKLQLEAHHLKAGTYLKMEGSYNFINAQNTKLQEAVISMIETFDEKEYYTRTNIILKT